jgi:hypothetical protein
MPYEPSYPSPPPNRYLEDALNSANDTAFKQRLYDAAPSLNFLGLRLGGSELSSADRAKAAQLGIDTSAITSPDLFSFGKWKALDAIKPKEQIAMTQLPMVKAAEDRQFQLQQYQIDRQQDLQKDQAQMQFDFGSKMADKQLQGAKELAEQQGKMGLRQSMFNSAMQRASTPINWLR